MGTRPPEDLEAELEALSAELAEARAEIEELRRALEGTGGREAQVAVDRTATVTEVLAWPWADPPAVGEPLAARFEAGSAAEVTRAADRRWIGVGEHRLTLVSGQVVALGAREAGSGFTLTLRDVTASALVDQAAENRKRMRAVSQLAGTLARELTDPISIVQGRLELLLGLPATDPEAVRRHLGVAVEHAHRVTATLQNLRMLGRTAEPPKEPVPFRAVVDEVLALLGPRASRMLTKVTPESLGIGCDGALPARVCASLARQALEASARGPVHLTASRSGSRVVVKIGQSSRSAGEAIELDDLALDRTLLWSVGGRLTTYRSGQVARFEVTLPAPLSPRARRGADRGHLLLVGRLLSEVVPTLLDREGYAFLHARTADQAIDQLERTPCTAVITELLLEGGASGLVLAELVGTRFSGSRFILVDEGDDPPTLPVPGVALRWPASRADLLLALGRRVRH